METKLYNRIFLVGSGMIVLAIIGTVSFPHSIAPLFMGAVGTAIAIVAGIINRSIIAAEKDDNDKQV